MGNNSIVSVFSAHALLIILTLCWNADKVLCNNSNSGVLSPTRCNREPPGHSGSKTPGDNGFSISILGNPTTYVPGVSYTVSLEGWRTPASVQKFVGFTIVAEPRDPGREIEIKNPGTFHLIGDADAKFSDQCQTAVTQASSIHKSKVTMLWKAPPAGYGCIRFKAMVIEPNGSWYMDDGGLTKELCEEEQENPDNQSGVIDECCACDEAKYEVTFQGQWSRHTHPKDFPQDNWQTHFSDIIGASHSSQYTMWEYGGYATEGLKYVAETGTTRKMEAEMKQQSDNIRTIIKARGLWFPNLNGSTFAVLRVDHKHHLMSLVSMLGPSPDWIAGVSRMELCLKNCSWITHKTLNLYPWDVGTDSGTTYVGPKVPTVPRDKIRRITPSYPNNPGSPFYDLSGEPMKPVARLTVTRQRLYEKPCGSDTLPTDDYEQLELTDDQRSECMTTPWTNSGTCSVTCGKGIQMRVRQYLIPMKASMFECKVPLTHHDICMGSTRVCEDDEEDEDELNGWKKDSEKCAVGAWSQWSECGVTCGKGFRTRTRKYNDRKARKTCYTTLDDREPCMANAPSCEDTDTVDPMCAVTQWSEWSPCMATCGKGIKVRTRIYIDPKAQAICRVELMQKTACMAEKADCNFDLQEAIAVCSQPRDEGPCRGHFQRWYFDNTKKTCMQFIHGGCRGNQNNFKKHEECNQICEVMKVPIDSPIVSQYGQHTMNQFSNMNKGPMPIDCVVSEWSPWSPCSATCGRGRKNRQRNIKVHPVNGGKACPKKLTSRRRCLNKPCH